MNRAWQGVLVLLAVALGARLVWELLGPLLPALGMVALLVGLGSLLVGRRRPY